MHPCFKRADELSHAVIGAAIEVHRLKGPGLIESIYEKCLMRELALRSLTAVNQRVVKIEYKGLCFEGRDLTEANEGNEGLKDGADRIAEKSISHGMGFLFWDCAGFAGGSPSTMVVQKISACRRERSPCFCLCDGCA